MAEQFTTPVGRLVGGHPMKRQQVMQKGKPAMQADGVTPATEAYIGVAIPKTPGLDWKQEPWGQAIVRAAKEGWTGGQTEMPSFAWKITDGDSTVPNRNNNVPNQREGYPGHWVLNMSTRMFIKCYHVGKYDPMTDQISNENEIKPGDYCRVCVDVKANYPAESPGVYLNPQLFELSRPGELIQLDGGPTAAEAFGGGAPAPQTGAPAPQTGAPAPQTGAPAPTPQPAPDFLNGPKPTPQEPNRLVDGTVYTAAQLRGYGWTEEQINSAPIAQ